MMSRRTLQGLTGGLPAKIMSTLRDGRSSSAPGNLTTVCSNNSHCHPRSREVFLGRRSSRVHHAQPELLLASKAFPGRAGEQSLTLSFLPSFQTLGSPACFSFRQQVQLFLEIGLINDPLKKKKKKLSYLCRCLWVGEREKWLRAGREQGVEPAARNDFRLLCFCNFRSPWVSL